MRKPGGHKCYTIQSEIICEISQHLYVMGIYRSPSGKLKDSLDIISTVMKETRAENNDLIMMSNMNVNILKPHYQDTQMLTRVNLPQPNNATTPSYSNNSTRPPL